MMVVVVIVLIEDGREGPVSLILKVMYVCFGLSLAVGVGAGMSRLMCAESHV